MACHRLLPPDPQCVVFKFRYLCAACCGAGSQEKELVSIRRNYPPRGYQRLMDEVTSGAVDLHEGLDLLR